MKNSLTKFNFIIILVLITVTNSKIIMAQVLVPDNSRVQKTQTNDHSLKDTPLKNIPYDEVKIGSLFVKSKHGFYSSLTQESNYQVNITGLLARVDLTQNFINESDTFIEAIYVFPLNESAAVNSLKMEIGNRIINGVIKEKVEALNIYQKAKNKGKKASIVSQNRPNMFTTKIANIAPGESIKITLSYLQPITYQDSQFSLRLPLTITPRFHPTQKPPAKSVHKNGAFELNETTEANIADYSEINVDVYKSGWALSHNEHFSSYKTEQDPIGSDQKVSINVKIDAGMSLSNINSHYHPITKTKSPNRDAYQVRLKHNKVQMDQDFYLSWQLSEGNKPKAAFFVSQDSDFNYGLLMVMPNKILYQSEQAKSLIEKEVVYIIDTSGSMGGVAIRQAKKALINAINKLNDKDVFNIIAFESTATKMYSSPMIASEQNKLNASNWVKGLKASGGTNMEPAIISALSTPVMNTEIEIDSKYKQVIFITDGAVTNEDELLSIIQTKLGHTRLHTVGIGSAPNGYFMSAAARVGKGTYRYIGDINEVSKEMDSLFELINNPFMTDIKLEWSVKNVEILPNNIPDLYQGTPLLITARWPKNEFNNNSLLNVKVSGILPLEKWESNLQLHKVSKTNGISTWWAREKIKELQFIKLKITDKSEKEALKSEITHLGLKHNLVTPYTSFIAVEEIISRSEEDQLAKKGIRNLIPNGTAQITSKIIPMANTSLGSLGYLILGLVLIFISAFLHFITFSNKLIGLFYTITRYAHKNGSVNDV